MAGGKESGDTSLQPATPLHTPPDHSGPCIVHCHGLDQAPGLPRAAPSSATMCTPGGQSTHAASSVAQQEQADKPLGCTKDVALSRSGFAAPPTSPSKSCSCAEQASQCSPATRDPPAAAQRGAASRPKTRAGCDDPARGGSSSSSEGGSAGVGGSAGCPGHAGAARASTAQGISRRVLSPRPLCSGTVNSASCRPAPGGRVESPLEAPAPAQGGGGKGKHRLGPEAARGAAATLGKGVRTRRGNASRLGARRRGRVPAERSGLHDGVHDGVHDSGCSTRGRARKSPFCLATGISEDSVSEGIIAGGDVCQRAVAGDTSGEAPSVAQVSCSSFSSLPCTTSCFAYELLCFRSGEVVGLWGSSAGAG